MNRSQIDRVATFYNIDTSNAKNKKELVSTLNEWFYSNKPDHPRTYTGNLIFKSSLKNVENVTDNKKKFSELTYEELKLLRKQLKLPKNRFSIFGEKKDLKKSLLDYLLEHHADEQRPDGDFFFDLYETEMVESIE